MIAGLEQIFGVHQLKQCKVKKTNCLLILSVVDQRNKLIYEYQFGFLQKYSKAHQLLEMYNCILNSLEKKEISCFVFCDISKAKLACFFVDGYIYIHR
jgi:hypothetical protein